MKDMLKTEEMGEENEREKVQSLNNKIVDSWRKNFLPYTSLCAFEWWNGS